jgi:hypothetical protein
MKNLDEGMEVMADMQSKLQRVLAGRQGSGQRAEQPLEPTILRGKSFALPHENRKLVGGGVLDGKTVAEALTYFVVCFCTLAVLVRYAPVCSLLDEERQIDREIHGVVEMMGRLTAPGSIY